MCSLETLFLLDTNLARDRPASQSTSWSADHFAPVRTADYAVDGDTNTDAYIGCAMTDRDDYTPWWRVDLQGVFLVPYVTITNRNDFGKFAMPMGVNLNQGIIENILSLTSGQTSCQLIA